MRTVLALSLVMSAAAWGQNSGSPAPGGSERTAGRLRIPNRPAKSKFEGEQGPQKTEINFDPATGIVTLKFVVQDPHGYFIPGIRPENFVVYENGVRQTNTTVEIEHALVSLALLMEFGGRHAAVNRSLADEVSTDAHEFLEIVGRQDKVAIWAYADRVTQLADFSPKDEILDGVMLGLKVPEVSETNLYDAVIFAVDRIRPVTGIKAIVLISSGVDTFSKATYDDALRAARSGTSPIYAISIGMALRNAAILQGGADLVNGIDWKTAEKNLGEIARASGGRLYSPTNPVDLPAMYDDMMENLKVRYVITYKSSNTADPKTPRTVRVELVNPKTGKPLEIVDKDGRPIRPSIIPGQTYVPNGTGQ
jgi:Ca-activated chloride channel family protein